MPRRRRRIRLLLAVVVGAALVGAVAGTAIALRGPSDYQRSRAASDRECGRRYVEPELRSLAKPDLRLTTLALTTAPSSLARDPNGEAPTLLGQRTGRVIALGPDGRPTGDVVLDRRDDTMGDGDGGLLALAYDPGGDWLYVYRSTADMDDVVTAYPLDASGRPVQEAEIEIIRSGHPASPQHHGGAMGFGPDGMLYVGFGDGGGLGDPRENAQDGSTLLGKLLRIDPTPDADEPYAVPPDNPFVDRDGWRPEIWALGVRNPYRLSFDEATGDLWLGDVGQSCWDEINRLTADDAGANLGWDQREGTAVFEGGRVPGDVVWPVHVTAHSDGWCAIVGGYVVRNALLPELDGRYLFTDYCSGELYALRPAAPGRPAEVVDTGFETERPVAVVEGPDGLPWILGLEGPVQVIRPRTPG